MTSLDAMKIVETITYQQRDEFIQRCVDDGFNPHYFGPCLIIFFHDGSSISFAPANPSSDYDLTAVFISPYTEGLIGCLRLVD